MNLTFTGGKELVAALRRIPEAVAERVLAGAVMAGGGIIQEAAAAKAPRAAERRRPNTVRLGDSIQTTVTEKGRSFVTVNVGTKVKYAHLVEYGHQIVPRGPARRRISVTRVTKSGRVSTRFVIDPDEKRQTRGAAGFVAARPFLRPAFDENRENVIRKIGEVMGAGIEAEAKRLAGSNA